MQSVGEECGGGRSVLPETGCTAKTASGNGHMCVSSNSFHSLLKLENHPATIEAVWEEEQNKYPISICTPGIEN